MSQNVNIRGEYDKLFKKYSEIGKGQVRLTMSEIILSVPIDPLKSSYTFPMLDNDQTVQPFEQRLNINDEFVMNSMGIYIGANFQDEEALVLPQYRWFTTPPTELGILGAKLENLYNGRLKIGVNNIIFVEKWHTKKHQYIPVTQAQNSTVGQPFATFPAADLGMAGMKNVTPTITFSGAKKNEITLDLPQPITPFAALMNVGLVPNALSMNCDRIFLRLSGWLAQNAASFQK